MTLMLELDTYIQTIVFVCIVNQIADVLKLLFNTKIVVIVVRRREQFTSVTSERVSRFCMCLICSVSCLDLSCLCLLVYCKHIQHLDLRVADCQSNTEQSEAEQGKKKSKKRTRRTREKRQMKKREEPARPPDRPPHTAQQNATQCITSHIRTHIHKTCTTITATCSAVFTVQQKYKKEPASRSYVSTGSSLSPLKRLKTVLKNDPKNTPQYSTAQHNTHTHDTTNNV